MSNTEQTLSIIKPDAVERNLTEKIKEIFISKNLKIKDTKKIHISKDEAAEFYKVHQSKILFTKSMLLFIIWSYSSYDIGG